MEEINKIVFCGSEKFNNLNEELYEFLKEQTKEKETYIQDILDDESYTSFEDTTDFKTEKLRQAKLQISFSHIDLASEIYVANFGGYIGDLTKKQIEYAKEKNKKIKYFYDKKDTNISLICGYRQDLEKMKLLQENFFKNEHKTFVISGILNDEYTENLLTTNEMDMPLENNMKMISKLTKEIDLANEIYIANFDGFIGKVTKKQIEYAKEKNKKISYFVNSAEVKKLDESLSKEEDDTLKYIDDILNKMNCGHTNCKNNKK